MKAKKKYYVALILSIFIAILLTGYLLYTPPLLNGRGYNIPGRVYNFFSYVYYSSLIEWSRNGGKFRARLRAAALAAWHRPCRTEELLGLNPDDLFFLGQKYADLGLDHQAVRLFREVLLTTLLDENKSLEIISYLALLGDWLGTERAAAEILRSNPDSAEAEYWWGRALMNMDQSDQAADHLRRAFQLQPDNFDALFQIGRLDERGGKKESACSVYERVVEQAPGHLGAWEGLIRLYEEGGDAAKLEDALQMRAELLPPVLVEKKYGNSFILFGYRSPEGVLTTGEPLELETYLTGWRPRFFSLRPEVLLSGSDRPDHYSLTGEVIALYGAGEVVKRRLCWTLPPVVYPGMIDWGIAFSNPVPTAGREEATGEREWLPLPSFQLKPGWKSAVDRGRLVRKYFGAGARVLGKSTFLGPGEELELNLNGGEMTGGVGIVSYLHRGSSVPQGEEVGRIFVTTDEGDEDAYPIIAGRDTAEVWREFAPPWQKKHQLAPIFISWQVDSGKKQFQAHEYYAILTFPRPFVVKSLKFINCSDKSGWYISNIVMVPPGDKAGS